MTGPRVVITNDQGEIIYDNTDPLPPSVQDAVDEGNEMENWINNNEDYAKHVENDEYKP